jgi:hypothetical protein
MNKKISLALFLIFCVFYTQAAIVTVSNFGGSPAMYTNLTTAINAASPDDTLLIHASATPYTLDDLAGFNKRLVVIGSGWNNLGTKIRGVNNGCGPGYGVPIIPGAEGSLFRGIEFISAPYIRAGQLIFESCRFNPEGNLALFTNNYPPMGYCGSYDDIAVQDIVFNNCYFNHLVNGLINDSNFLFQNCIFRKTLDAGNIGFTGSETLSPTNPHIFDHNIFLSNVEMDLSNAVFTNNVFFGVATENIGGGNFCYDCQFENNMTYCADCLLSSITGADLINNLENQPEPFVNNTTDFTQADFHLVDASGGNNYGNRRL